MWRLNTEETLEIRPKRCFMAIGRRWTRGSSLLDKSFRLQSTTSPSMKDLNQTFTKGHGPRVYIRAGND